MKKEDPLGLALKKMAEQPGDAPVSLEAEVFSTLDALLLLADMADLFTTKFAQTELYALNAVFSEKQDKEGNP